MKQHNFNGKFISKEELERRKGEEEFLSQILGSLYGFVQSFLKIKSRNLMKSQIKLRKE